MVTIEDVVEGIREERRLLREFIQGWEAAEARSQKEREAAEIRSQREREAAEIRSQREREAAEARFQKEREAAEARSQKEREAAEAKFDREWEKSRIEFEKQNAEFDRRWKELNETVMGMSKSDGLYAEEYFFNSFEQGKKTFFGETFDKIERNIKCIEPVEARDEYDIVLINGKSVGIIEVKYRGRVDDIPKIINKASTFRVHHPSLQNHRIYLAMASMTFHKRLEDECLKKGIAIVKQVGETVVINDAHLRAY